LSYTCQSGLACGDWQIPCRKKERKKERKPRCALNAPPKVLVVEDNPALRFALSEKLEQEGYAVLLASNGCEALALLEDSDVALVLCDLGMSDGRGLLRALRAHPRHASLPVVLMLTYPWDALTIQVEYPRKGADAFLVKPFLTDADLRAALQRALGSG